MRIYLFEEDPSLLNMLVLYLRNRGHQVQGFASGYKCPLYLLEECTCPAAKPCADAVVVSTRIPDEESLQILIDQDTKGCKLPKLNKAVMSANFTEAQETLVQDKGFSIVKKPFRLAAIDRWLEGCAKRLQLV